MGFGGLTDAQGNLVLHFNEALQFQVPARSADYKADGMLYFTTTRLVWLGERRGGAKIHLGLSLTAVVRTAVGTAASKMKMHELHIVVPNQLLVNVQAEADLLTATYQVDGGYEALQFQLPDAAMAAATIRQWKTNGSAPAAPTPPVTQPDYSYLLDMPAEEFDIRQGLGEFGTFETTLYRLSQNADPKLFREVLLRYELGELSQEELLTRLRSIG